MPSQASTVAEYLAELTDERRAIVEVVRRLILANVDSQIEEGIQYGMIGYFVPHRLYPQGYHCDPSQPLPYMALASQKNHFSLHLMCCYGSNELELWMREAFERAGKKLDMGKACVRFKRLEDLSLEAIAELIRRVPSTAYIARYEATFLATRKAKKRPKKS
jgi:hypothetical protein